MKPESNPTSRRHGNFFDVVSLPFAPKPNMKHSCNTRDAKWGNICGRHAMMPRGEYVQNWRSDFPIPLSPEAVSKRAECGITQLVMST